jgi:hypothetical protein
MPARRLGSSISPDHSTGRNNVAKVHSELVLLLK